MFLESFYGQSASDNPLGIDRALADLRPRRRATGASSTGRSRCRTGGVRIIEGSREWWRVRGAARVLIVNDWLRKRFRRRPGQHVLQTWHGTMLKRLALDRAGVGIRTRIAVRRERARWDALLAQNAYSAEIFRRRYDMRDPIWEDGYPRNDVLQLDAGALAERTRRRPPCGRRRPMAHGSCSTHRPGATTAPRWSTTSTSRRSPASSATITSCSCAATRARLRYGQDLAGDHLIDVTSYPNIDRAAAARRRLRHRLLVVDVRLRGHRQADRSSSPPTSRTTAPTCAGFYFDLLAEAPGPVVQDARRAAGCHPDREQGSRRDPGRRTRGPGGSGSPRSTTGTPANASCGGCSMPAGS